MAAPSVLSLVHFLREVQVLELSQLEEVDRDLGQRLTDPKELARELVQRGWLTPFQVNQIARGKGRELTLGPYVLLELLGEGGMGQVFKARHRTLERLCAVKQIRTE